MRTWTTPEGIAFEGVQTGDGRIFTAGAFYWDDSENGWPLRFDREDDGWHAGAVLVGSIAELSRGDQADELTPILSRGDIDDESDMGGEVTRMLDNDAPLGVSVDMDDLAVEWVVSTDEVEDEEGGIIILAASFPEATLMRRRRAVTAGSTHTALVWEVHARGIGRLHRQVLEDFGAERTLTAAAGDGDLDDDDSVVLMSESMDEVLTRFTRARIRGATLVDIPAFDRAYIRLDPAEGDESSTDDDADDESLAALLADGSQPLTVIGAAGLPLADRDRSWDGSGAHQRMAGDGDSVDTATMRRGHFYLDPDADSDTAGAYHLPFADLIDGTLTAVPKGLFAVAGVLQGARGGANIPEAEQDRIKSKVSAYYAAMRRKFDDDSIVPPWDDSDARADGTVARVFAEARRDPALVAAAAAAPMRPPAAWFTTPQWTPGQVVELEDPVTGRKLRGVPMEYRDDGEVVGHLALWGQCHTGSNGECILTPRSALGYVPFHHGQIELDDGTLLPVGNLTLGGGHADGRLSYAGALQHYDDVSALAAQGRCGEDDYGVWFHGAGMPDVWSDELAMRKLRAASPSGDWRTVGAGLELTAALGVCAPGFPVPRAMVASSGEVVSLVAAGAREAALLRTVADGPRGQRLAELVEAAVQRGVQSYVRQQDHAAAEPARRELERLARERAIEVLQGT
jgi:hypothetical protein